MSKRELTTGKKRYTKVICTDEPGQGGACHEYYLCKRDKDDSVMGLISFQEGPSKENPINGCLEEDLIEVLIDRLEHFQKGDYACGYNALALEKLNETLLLLEQRKADRDKRGVFGTSKI